MNWEPYAGAYWYYQDTYMDQGTGTTAYVPDEDYEPQEMALIGFGRGR